MITDAQAQALAAIRDLPPLDALPARAGVTLDMGWVLVPSTAGVPPTLSAEGRKLLTEWETAQGWCSTVEEALGL